MRDIAFKEDLIEDIIIFCDLCDSSFIRDNRLPVLRVIPNSTNRVHVFDDPVRIPVSRDEIKRIRIFIRTIHMEIPSFIVQPVICTLQIRKEKN